MAVVVLTYNGRSLIETCLRSVRASSYPRFRVVVVDNASTDGTADLVRSTFPEVALMRNETNLGFAAAYNRAIRDLTDDFVVLLNQDTEVANPRWIDELVARAQSGGDVASVACRLLFRSDPSLVNSLGGMAYWWTGTVDLAYGEADGAAGRQDPEPFAASGGAMLVRREAFLAAGGFDETFFMYCEDFDLGWRLRLLGYRALLASEARVLHDVSPGLGRMGPAKVYLVHRNFLRAMLKNYAAPSLVRGLPQYLVFTALKSVGLGVGSRSRALFWAPWRALGWNAVVLRDTMGERRKIQAARRIPDREILRRMGPSGFEPYASLRRRLALSAPA